MFRFFIIAMFCWSATSSIAQSVSGTVMDEDGEPIPFAQVMLKGTPIGVEAEQDGVFELLDLDTGSHKLVISSIGFQRKEIPIKLVEGQALSIEEVSLFTDMLGLQEVVVTGTMRETFLKASPVKVEVIKTDRITKNIPATNLMEGLQMINGVQEVNACGVCFTNNISINGLPGQYSAVLMDGTPIYGNLASVYGLNGIPMQMVDRIEVIKGPSSTLYGSEAIAGVINIITKDPEHQPSLAVDVMATSHAEVFTNVAVAHKGERWNGHTGVNAVYMNRYEDFNEDGFGDMIAMDRVSLFSKWSMERPGHKKFTIAGKLYYEDRRNGVERFMQGRDYRKLRGNDSIYGESILTRRAEVFGTYEFPASSNWRIDYSLSWHDQDSYYGSDHYEAEQAIAFSNLIWINRWRNHTLTAGMSNRFQYYDDNTIATNEAFNNQPERQYIPGLFLEDEWQPMQRLTLLGGVRLDLYPEHGLIPAPRFSTKYDLDEWTSVRLNAGTGFKIVNLFTEDHAFVTGQRSVEIVEELRPERSWNVSTNFNHTHALFGTSGALDVDVFYTRFTNKINPNYDVPDKIIYENIPGFASSYGMAFTFSQQFTKPLSYSIGANLNRATTTELLANGEEVVEALLFAPLWSGILTVNYRIKAWKLDLAYTANLTGTMALPEVFDLDSEGNPLSQPRPQRSNPFLFHNIQATKCFGAQDRWTLYGGVQNIFDYKQAVTPLVGYNDPAFATGFSPNFDTSYSFAPIHGREIFFGLRVNL